MIVGIGIDTVSVPEFATLRDGVFDSYIFSAAELAWSASRPDQNVSLAGIFAVKEAVAKALGNLDVPKDADMRDVEVGRHENGAPCVVMTERMQSILQQAGVGSVLVSITNEGDTASAIALAQTEHI